MVIPAKLCQNLFLFVFWPYQLSYGVFFSWAGDVGLRFNVYVAVCITSLHINFDNPASWSFNRAFSDSSVRFIISAVLFCWCLLYGTVNSFWVLRPGKNHRTIFLCILHRSRIWAWHRKMLSSGHVNVQSLLNTIFVLQQVDWGEVTKIIYECHTIPLSVEVISSRTVSSYWLERGFIDLTCLVCFTVKQTLHMHLAAVFPLRTDIPNASYSYSWPTRRPMPTMRRLSLWALYRRQSSPTFR